MTSEKKSVSEDSNMTDYANLAFNPYAISTDDLTFSTFGGGEPIKNGKSMANGGFEPEPFVETNPHYEDTAEVVEKAGLSGTGRRKKENVVYEAAGYKVKKPKSEKRPEPPRIRSSNIPPRPPEDWSGVSKSNNTRWKLPFVILCILVIICLIGTALGVLAYFKDEKCSCNNNIPESQKVTQESNYTSRLNDVENEFAKNFREIFARLDMMNAVLDDLQKTQRIQQEKLIQTNATMNMVKQQLNTAIHTINSTFNIKLQNVNYNVSSLSNDVQELRNISKQMGPRGFNGTQGPQGLPGLQGSKGEPGVGNLSACVVREKVQRATLAFDGLGKATVSHDQTPGWKVMSAVCSTRVDAGAIHNVLSINNSNYKCTCAGESTETSFKPKTDAKGKKHIDCVMIYWECPLLT